NVVPVVADPSADPLTRAVAAWSEASRCHSPYCLHDADPLAAVASAWERRYDTFGDDGSPVIGELEVAIHETVAAWRAGSLELPDYYVVVDADRFGETRRHWYLGVLHAAAPSRVMPCSGGPAEVTAILPRLISGRWWPALDHLLDGIDRVVPERVR